MGFNTQPPEGGWHIVGDEELTAGVSTHSRLKAAGAIARRTYMRGKVSTHSRLKAAGPYFGFFSPNRWFQHTAA